MMDLHRTEGDPIVKLTKNQTEQATLTAMYRALDKRQPVTLTYVKKDGTTTIRTVELFDIRSTKAGAVMLRGMDRETGEARSFLVAGITAYTTHRTAYTVDVPADDQPAPAPVPRTVAALTAYEIARDERPARRQLAPAA